jgi:hypothetical protein
MGWQIRGGPAWAKVANPSRTVTVLIARREKVRAFILDSPQFADLTHASRDAESKWSVNKASRNGENSFSSPLFTAAPGKVKFAQNHMMSGNSTQ